MYDVTITESIKPTLTPEEVQIIFDALADQAYALSSTQVSHQLKTSVNSVKERFGQLGKIEGF
jgi:hypothetical protein